MARNMRVMKTSKARDKRINAMLDDSGNIRLAGTPSSEHEGPEEYNDGDKALDSVQYSADDEQVESQKDRLDELGFSLV